MTLRSLPTTVRDLLASLRHSLGPPGVVVGVLVLPIVLLAAVVSFPFIWIARRLSRQAPEAHRTLEIGPSDVLFSWTGSAASCRAALEDALRLVLDSVSTPDRSPGLATLEIRNPDTGFAVDPAKQGLIAADHAGAAASRLWGESVEYGELVIDAERRLAGLTVDARSPVAGHLGIDLPPEVDRAALAARARALGLEVFEVFE